MLAILTALVVITLFDPPAQKEPPTKAELTAITDRGRDLAGYDAAAWHASDALQAKQPKEGSVDRYIARKIDKKWVVAFGRERHHDHRGGFRAGCFPGVELQRDRDCQSRSHSLGRAVTWHRHWIR